MIAFKEIRDSILHLFFPHVCDGCGDDGLNIDSRLCLRCINDLPFTDFEKNPDNPVEKIFWGRLPFVSASAAFYFTKGALVQQLMHELKYRGNKEIGIQLGKIMGTKLLESKRFDADAIIPLPLFHTKERRRGYNQATVISEGISQVTGIPVLNQAVERSVFTETQTKKTRIERWKNIEGKFILTDPQAIKNKHLLLIDDVITTGATLEACGEEILKGENTRLSIATLCIASR